MSARPRTTAMLTALAVLLVIAAALLLGRDGTGRAPSTDAERPADPRPLRTALDAARAATDAQPDARAGAVTPSRSVVRSEQPISFDRPERVTGATVNITLTPVGARPAARHRSPDGYVAYASAWPGVDVVRREQPTALKESIVVRHGERRGSFTWNVRGNAKLHLEADGRLSTTVAGRPTTFAAPAPVVLTTSGDAVRGALAKYSVRPGTRAGHQVLTLHWSVPPSTSFPFNVDPTFTTAQAASSVLGATSFTDPTGHMGHDQWALGDVYAIASGGSKLMISENYGYSSTVGNRVFYYNAVPTTNAQPFDGSIGNNSSGATGFYRPQGVWTDGTRVAVADSQNHRVLIWNTIPATNSTPADIVLGQPNLTSVAANNGGVSASSMRYPRRVFFDGTRFIVADYENHRVLIWNSFPTTTGQAADLVLGQADMYGTAANRGGARNGGTLSYPDGIWGDGTSLFISDASNHRVLKWNTFPTTNGQSADIALGQTSLTGGTCRALAGKAGICTPRGLSGGGGALFLADVGDDRVLKWNTLPTSDGQAADIQIGRRGTAGTTSQLLRGPSDVTVIGSKLAINDQSNNRVLIYNTIPTADDAAADHVVGQVDFVHDGLKGGQGEVLVEPSSADFDASGRLFVGNLNAQHILRFPASLPPVGATADLSIGQDVIGGRGVGNLDVRGVVYGMRISDDGKLLAAGAHHGRAYWWNTIPTTTTPTTISGVVGQATLTASGRNRNGATARDTIGGATDIDWDGTHLAVTDYQNHRVLIWNGLPSNGQAADVVIGQPNDTSSTPNNGGISSSSINDPYGVKLYRGKMIVADRSNNRVLIWNSIPTTDNAPADVVVGQPNMSSNVSVLSPTTMRLPSGVDAEDGALVVADRSNRRVLVYDQIPTTNGAIPDRVIGQTSLSTATLSYSATGMIYPVNVALQAGRLAVVDGNQRVLVYDDVLAPNVSNINAVQAGERTTFSFATDEDAVGEVVYDTAPHPGGSGYAFSTGTGASGRTHQLVASGLVPGSTYYYRIVTTDSHGNISQSAEYSVVTTNVSTFVLAPTLGRDATISELAPINNFGSAQTLDVGASGASTNRRALLGFDLSQLPPGATIDSATLTLTATHAGGGTAPPIQVRRALGAWTEGVGDDAPQPEGASWETMDGVDPWTDPGGDAIGTVLDTAPAPAAASGAVDLDVTPAVSDWVTNGDPNDGLLIGAASEPATDLVSLASADNLDPAKRPKLVVQWQGSDVTNPQLGSVRIRPLSSVSLEVSWDTDESSTSRVDYGPTTAYGATISDPTNVNRHVVVLNDLSPNTLYHLRVRSTDAQGNESVSGDHVTRTSYRAQLGAVDTFVRADMPLRNNGKQSSLFVGNASGTWQRASSFLRFDVSTIPAGATVQSAQLELTSNAQAGATAPTLGAYALTAPFTEGTGNANVGPPQSLVAGTVIGHAPFGTPGDRHIVLGSTGWLSMFGFFDVNNRDLRYRRSVDGVNFGTDGVLLFSQGRTGVAIERDGATNWIASLVDSTSTFDVRRIDDTSMATTTSGSLTLGTSVTMNPGMVLASDGHLWVKGESPTGEIWAARSNAPRDPSAWTTTQLFTQSTPGHGVLVPLAGGNMAALSQDGGMISLRTWNGTVWSGASLVAANAAPVTGWSQNQSMAAVTDGSGGIWLTYRSATNDAVAIHYSGAVWGSPETIAAGSASAVAISLDTGANVPHVAWLSGTNIMLSRRTGGVWSAAQTLQASISGSLTQVSMSPPSDEALAVTWAEPSGGNSSIRWRGYALDKTPDGATWNTRDGSTSWTAPGGDEAGAPIATAPATNAVGNRLTMDLTNQVDAWHTGAPNHGFSLRKETDAPAATDWKSYYSSEVATPSLRPRLVVDYDIATVTVSQPNASTAWRNGQTAVVAWQTSGSGLTHVNLHLSDDNGATWSPIATNVANTGSYFWQVAGSTGDYRIKIEALALGSVVTDTVSDSFVVENLEPDPITDLQVNSPSSAATLTWTQPADNGGAGMANGNYRVYRSPTNGVLGSRIATISGLTHTDNSALADGPWYYTVIPVDAAGNAQTNGNDQVVTQHDGSPPNAVTDLAAPGLTNQPIALTWSAVSDVGPAGTTGYRVHRSSVLGVRGTLLRTVAGTTDTDTPPSDGTWYYTVTPVDAAGNVRLTGNNQIGAVYDSTAPAPVSISVDAGASWTGTRNVSVALTSSDASQVQLSEDPTFTGASWVAVAAVVPFQLSAVDGGHIVYARFRDAAGNVSSTATDSIGLDRVAPSAVTALRDGVVASDRDYQGFLTQLSATWTAATDAHSGIATYELCLSTSTNCGGTVLSPWNAVGVVSTSTVTGLTLTAGSTYFTCVRSVDGVGNTASACTDGITVTSLTSIVPNTAPQGRKGLVLVFTGAGLDPASTFGFSGTGVTVTDVNPVNSTRIDVEIDVTASATLGSRTGTITYPDGFSSSTAPAVTVTAPAVSISLGTLDYDGTAAAPATSGPYGVDLGTVLPGTSRQLGPPTSGQAAPGAAVTLDVQSDTDWSLSTSATDFTGPAPMPSTRLAWKHHGVTEAWSPFTTSSAGIETQRVPNAPGWTSFSYDLQWTVPGGQLAGAYATTMSYVVVPAP